MPRPPDPYLTLGVAASASLAQIKTAWRKLARRHHPDVAGADPKDEARFKEINAAYQLLSDPEQRERYDLSGSIAGVRPRGRPRFDPVTPTPTPRAAIPPPSLKRVCTCLWRPSGVPGRPCEHILEAAETKQCGACAEGDHRHHGLEEITRAEYRGSTSSR